MKTDDVKLLRLTGISWLGNGPIYTDNDTNDKLKIDTVSRKALSLCQLNT